MSDILRSSEIDRILRDSSEDEDNENGVYLENASDLSDEVIEHNDFSDVSEIDGDEEVFEEISDDVEFILGKDGETIWCTSEVTEISKSRRKNIIKKLPGPKECAKNVSTEIEAFLKLITIEMMDEILQCTNKHIISISNNFRRERDCFQSNRSEIMALFGVLYLIGIKKGAHANVKELWASDGTGVTILRAAMSYNRLLFLLRCIRFDDKDTREDRRKVDKLAPIRNILDSFVQNCKHCYNTGEFVTIDEMLHRFRGRCSFVQYMPNKPAKYGLKLFAMCDAKTYFCSNFEVYCGKQPSGPYEVQNSALEIVKRLIHPIEQSNKNVTTDNWYTSLPLADCLLEKGLTLIGTLKKNKAAIPPSFLPSRTKEVKSSVYGFQFDKTLVSYVTKKKNCVVLLSTMHDSKVTNEDTGKSEIIMDYNMTKGGVDTCDKMCASYSVSRITRRWPLALFYVFMNLASINARVILVFNKNDEVPERRKVFQKNLALSLMRNHLEDRAKIKSLPLDLYSFLAKYRQQAQENQVDKEQPAKKRGTCWMCGRAKNSSASMKCSFCSRFVCKQHTQKQIVCLHCGGDKSIENSDS